MSPWARPPETVIVAKCGNCATGDGLGHFAAQIGKGEGRRDARGGSRLSFSTFAAFLDTALGFQARLFGGFARRLDLRLDRGDEVLQGRGLFGELGGAGLLGGEIFGGTGLQRPFLFKQK